MTDRITLDTPIKFLNEDGSATHAGKKSYPINRWMRVKGDLVPCENGYHYTAVRHWRGWLTTRIHLVEAEEGFFSEDKFCARGIRLAPRLETWTLRTATLFAADCAERALPIFERAFPADQRPRQAIEAARSGCGAVEVARATEAARSAAWAAAWAAAGAAEAAGAAAWEAAGAAGAAAWSAEVEWQDARLLQYLNGEV